MFRFIISLFLLLCSASYGRSWIDFNLAMHLERIQLSALTAVAICSHVNHQEGHYVFLKTDGVLVLATTDVEQGGHIDKLNLQYQLLMPDCHSTTLIPNFCHGTEGKKFFFTKAKESSFHIEDKEGNTVLQQSHLQCQPLKTIEPISSDIVIGLPDPLLLRDEVETYESLLSFVAFEAFIPTKSNIRKLEVYLNQNKVSEINFSESYISKEVLTTLVKVIKQHKHVIKLGFVDNAFDTISPLTQNARGLKDVSSWDLAENYSTLAAKAENTLKDNIALFADTKKLYFYEDEVFMVVPANAINLIGSLKNIEELAMMYPDSTNTKIINWSEVLPKLEHLKFMALSARDLTLKQYHKLIDNFIGSQIKSLSLEDEPKRQVDYPKGNCLGLIKPPCNKGWQALKDKIDHINLTTKKLILY